MAERYNQGSAWFNKEKTKETQSSYRGTVNIEGVLHFVDVWVKPAKDGNKFLSFSFKKREKQDGVQAGMAFSQDDDVPL